MIIHIAGIAGQPISLDLRQQLGERVEIECFHFLVPAIEFRLVRNGVPLQDWQLGTTEMYDLQHPTGAKTWSRDGHWFLNDLEHRSDVATCGALARDLALETTGLGFPIGLLVWPRESTCCRSASSGMHVPIL